MSYLHSAGSSWLSSISTEPRNPKESQECSVKTGLKWGPGCSSTGKLQTSLTLGWCNQITWWKKSGKIPEFHDAWWLSWPQPPWLGHSEPAMHRWHLWPQSNWWRSTRPLWDLRPARRFVTQPWEDQNDEEMWRKRALFIGKWLEYPKQNERSKD